jgi:UDP-N-acetylmuramoyl-tripeptide--D-alanyl-D-alanine ligase
VTSMAQPGDTVLVKSSNSAGLRHLGDRLGEWFA